MGTCLRPGVELGEGLEETADVQGKKFRSSFVVLVAVTCANNVIRRLSRVRTLSLLS